MSKILFIPVLRGLKMLLVYQTLLKYLQNTLKATFLLFC